MKRPNAISIRRSSSRRAFAVSIIALFMILTNPVGAAQSPAERLAGRAVGETPLMEDLRELCDSIGGRMSGSEACERSIEWGARKFKEVGVKKVSLEEFTVPLQWLPEGTEASCLSPESFDIRTVSAPYSPSTQEGKPLTGRLVDGGTGKPEDFEKLGASAKGAIALVSISVMKSLGDLFGEYIRNKAMLDAADEAGIAGIFLMSTRERNLLYRHPVTMGDRYAPMPVVLIAREHAMRLSRLMEQGEVQVSMTARNKTGGPYKLRNVIAEIPGREKPEEIVLLGAHLDSWDLGTGAADNGVNVALVIDVARGLMELDLQPRRTIRFALFTGEEQGLWGSAGYVQSHADEMDDHVAVVIHDLGWGRVTGYFLSGRDELRRGLDKAMGVVKGLGPFNHAMEAIDGTDNFDFLLSGVPNLVAIQNDAPYLPDYHAESDVFERVDAREARANAAIAAALVWGLADSPRRLGKRQSREEVEEVIQKGHLEAVMKSFGQWEDWKAGRRGVHKTD